MDEELEKAGKKVLEDPKSVTHKEKQLLAELFSKQENKSLFEERQRVMLEMKLIKVRGERKKDDEYRCTLLYELLTMALSKQWREKQKENNSSLTAK